MDYNSLLGEKRWEILKIIAGSPASPIEISEKLGTTVSYVSQQLKLLEVAGLIKKERTGNVEKGKPRNIYSIISSFFSYTFLDYNFAIKKNINLDIHKKIVLKIWSLENSLYHIPLEKFFLELEKDLGKIEGVFLKQHPKYKLVVVGKKEVERRLGKILKSLNKEIDLDFQEELSPAFFSEPYLNLYNKRGKVI